MSPQHAASLLKQPDTQLVPRHGRLGDPPGQGGKVRLAETVVTVGQQTKPRKTKNLNCTSRNVYIFLPVFDIEMIKYKLLDNVNICRCFMKIVDVIKIDLDYKYFNVDNIF